MSIRKTKNDQEIYQEYINYVEYVQNKESKTQKEQFLLNKGLYRLVQCQKGEEGCELDPNDRKYWKKIPIEITLEQYETLLGMQSEPILPKDSLKKVFTSLATIMGILIMVIGIISAIFLWRIPIIGQILSIQIGTTSIFIGILCITLGIINKNVKKIYEYLRFKLK